MSRKIKNATNILKSIKIFLKKHAKILYNILTLTNKVCEFFESRYSILINRMFIYIKKT